MIVMHIGFGGRARRAIVSALALTAALAACGDSVSEPTAAESAFCSSVVSFDAVSTPGGPQDPQPPEMQAYAREVAGPVAGLESNAPASIAASVQGVAAAVGKARAGDTSALSDGYQADRATIENWAYKNCGFQRLNMTGTDYGFQGVPKSLKAGEVAVRLKNEGKEFHVVLWLKRAPGDDRPAPEVIGWAFGELASSNFDPNRSQALGFVDGEPAVAAPGQTGSSTTDLAPGRYILFCPVGVEGHDDETHFEHGMFAEVTVS